MNDYDNYKLTFFNVDKYKIRYKYVKYISYFTVTILLIISICNQSPKRTLNLESYLRVVYS